MRRKTILKIYRKYKPIRGFNTKELVRCTCCGKIFESWDTQRNLACPYCKGKAPDDNLGEEGIKENIFRLSEKLYSPWRASNILSVKEMGMLSNFRETKFEKELNRFIDSCFQVRENYKNYRAKQYLIDKRGVSLLRHPVFLELLENCYKLIDKKEVI